MKICYIVGAGELHGAPSPKDGDFVIAADGGYAHLRSLGIRPDVLLGDFDSLSVGKEESFSFEGCHVGSLCGNDALADVEIIRYPVMKDETDMYLAYKIGVERGYSEFRIYGGVGGRDDHTFANYCLLLRAKNENNNVYLYGNKSVAFVVKNEKIELCGEQGKGISVFAFGGDAAGVSIRGLRYEARDIRLAAEFPLGVSNSFKNDRDTCEISVRSGALLIIREL